MKTSDFYVNNSKDYKPPTYVDKLPPKTPIGGGAPVTIDEVNNKLYLFKLINFFKTSFDNFFKTSFFYFYEKRNSIN